MLVKFRNFIYRSGNLSLREIPFSFCFAKYTCTATILIIRLSNIPRVVYTILFRYKLQSMFVNYMTNITLRNTLSVWTVLEMSVSVTNSISHYFVANLRWKKYSSSLVKTVFCRNWFKFFPPFHCKKRRNKKKQGKIWRIERKGEISVYRSYET